MARFYGEGVNGRGNVVPFGGRGSAGWMHLRGWDAGVKVVPIAGETDQFQVWMTTGSHESGQSRLLGTVVETPDGPVFHPAWDSENTPSYIDSTSVL